MQFFTRNWIYNPNFAHPIQNFLRLAPRLQNTSPPSPSLKVCVWSGIGTYLCTFCIDLEQDFPAFQLHTVNVYTMLTITPTLL